MSTEIYTSYYSNYKNIPSEYQCLSISISKPEGICIPKWDDVVPPKSLVEDYKAQQITSCDFAYYYTQYLQRNPLVTYSDYLHKFKQPIVLMCHEKDFSYCHRSILAWYLHGTKLQPAVAIYKGEYGTEKELTIEQLLDAYRRHI